MPSQFDCTETAMFCNTVLGAESRVLCKHLDAMMMKDDAGGFVLQMTVVFDRKIMVRDLGMSVCAHKLHMHGDQNCWLATAL